METFLKTFLVIGLCLSLSCSFSQQGKQKTVSISGKFDRSLVSKDGYHFEGYIIDIGQTKAEKLDGHLIKVTGKEFVIIVPMNNKDSIIRQERKGVTKYILSPKIKIID